MPHVVNADWLQRAQLIKQLVSHYRQNQDLIAVGAYQAGADPMLDLAIERLPGIKAMLRQRLDEGSTLADSEKQLFELLPKAPAR
jgi:flagellum-specific ATP synthase